MMLAATGAGCATIVDGTTQLVSFNSTPGGAEVTLNGAPVGTTPLSLEVKRSKDMSVMFKKNGYEPQTIALQTKLNTTFWGNIITGGVYGSTTDAISGASVEYSPNQYYVTLNAVDATEDSKAETFAKNRARDFILVNFDEIEDDLGDGEGEYLSGLLSVLEVPAGRTAESVRKLRSLLNLHGDDEIPAFADDVIRHFME